MRHNWIPTIGLEIHVQLKTDRKLFSFAGTDFGANANSQASYIDLGLPGTLPIPNRDAMDMAIKFGLCTQSKIAETMRFSRKNYFYPDLPKGYQITQDAYPVISGGSLDILLDSGVTKTVSLERAHLEEDAGKSIHDGHISDTGLDFNRAGIALLEIVTEPVLDSAKEAILFFKMIRSLVVYLDICTGNMQEGALRCDANVSVRPNADAPLGTRAEIKNLNSFKYIEKAINYEISRQIERLESGKKIAQETRLFDTNKGITKLMRSKEDSTDYRYFPDPDLPSISIGRPYIANIKATLPELPWEKHHRFVENYSLSEYDAELLTTDKYTADFYEAIFTDAKISPKLAANWLNGEIAALLNKNNLDLKDAPITSHDLGQLLESIEHGTISGSAAKIVLETFWEKGSPIPQIIEELGLAQINDPNKLSAMIDDILKNNDHQLQQYLGGKDKLFGFFIGQAMKQSKGKANPSLINKILKQKLNELSNT